MPLAFDGTELYHREHLALTAKPRSISAWLISHRPTDHIPNHHKQHRLLSSSDFCDNDSDFCAGAGTGTCTGTGTGSPAGAAFSPLRGSLRASRHPRALPASLPPCRRRACAPRPLQRPLAAAEAQVSGRRCSAAPRGAAPSRAGPGRVGRGGKLRGAPEARWSPGGAGGAARCLT